MVGKQQDNVRPALKTMFLKCQFHLVADVCCQADPGVQAVSPRVT